MNISDLFSERTSQALQEAASLVLQKHQRAIDTEHILYALTKDESVMARILKELGLDREQLAEQLLRQIPENMYTGNVYGANISLSPRAAQVIQLAHEESIQLGHNYIGTEHLF